MRGLDQLRNDIRSEELIGSLVEPIEEALLQDNEQYSMGSSSKIASTLQSIMDKIDFWDIDYIQRYGSVYWCGILTAEPFGELDDSEENILNLIKEHHLMVKDHKKTGVFIEFIPNTKSPLYRFFYRHRDGYGLNIPASVNLLIRTIVLHMKRVITDSPDAYGAWEDTPEIQPT